MIKRNMLVATLCFGLIICSTLPSLANNHKAPKSKIVMLSRGSGGGGGGGGGSSSGGGGGGGGSSSGGGGGGRSSGASGGGGGSSSGGSSGGGGGSYSSIYDSDGNLVARYDISAEGSWVSGDGTYGGGAIQIYQGNSGSSASGGGNGSSIIGPGIGAGASGGGGPTNIGAGASGGGSGWEKSSTDSKWYYYEKDNSANQSKKATGWKEIDSSWYYFGNDGAMYQNTVTPDGYYVDANGAWVK